MQPAHCRKVTELLEVEEPEPPGLRLQRTHGVGGVDIVRGARNQAVELLVGRHEDRLVVGLGGLVEPVAKLGEGLTNSGISQPRRTADQDALDFATHFDELEMVFDIDVQHDRARTRKNLD